MLACCHTLRLKMAEVVHQVVINGTRKYRMVRDHCHEELHAKYDRGLEGMDTVHEELEEGLAKSPVEMLHSVVRNLRQAIQKCECCRLMIEEDRQRLEGQKHPIPLRRVTVKEAAARHRNETLKGAKSMHQYVGEANEESWDGGDEGPDGGDEDDDDGPGSEEVVQEGQNLEGGVSAEGGGKTPRAEGRRIPERDRKQARIGRFPRPVAAALLPARRHLRGLHLPL
jgi:hypothetical protein